MKFSDKSPYLGQKKKGGESMPNNHGRLREDEMIIQLHGKQVKQLNQNLHYLLEELFGNFGNENLFLFKYKAILFKFKSSDFNNL